MSRDLDALGSREVMKVEIVVSVTVGVSESESVRVSARMRV